MIIYAAIGLAGFILLLAMLVLGDFGGGDHEIAAHDGAIDHMEGELSGPSIFSVRIMAAFLTAFGVGGVLGRYYELSHPASSGIGVISGVAMAAIVYQFAKILFSQQASSEIRMSSLVGRTAEVSIAIPPGGVGQIALVVAGERTEHLARAATGGAVARGTEVTITALRGDSVIVTSGTAPAAGGTS
jgi:membrane protein implicated in regulation of membrane protease activity